MKHALKDRKSDQRRTDDRGSGPIGSAIASPLLDPMTSWMCEHHCRGIVEEPVPASVDHREPHPSRH